MALRNILLTLALLTSLATVARAQMSTTSYADYGFEGLYGWYEAGVAQVEDATLEDFSTEVLAGNSIRFDTGFHFGIAMGCEITPYFKFEVESGLNYNSLDTIGGAASSSGNLYRVPVFANFVFQLPNRTGIVPVIGAGVGAQWCYFDAQNVALGATTLSDSSDTWVFGYQGYAGLRYEFRDDMSLGVFYHYSVADGPSWNFDGVPGNVKFDSIRTHTLSITFGWIF